MWELLEERPLSEADQAAGVVRDVTVKRLGTDKHNALLIHPLRVVEVESPSQEGRWVLVTNHLDLSAELVAVVTTIGGRSSCSFAG